MRALSQRQEQVLDFVVECLADPTIGAPSHLEIAEEFSITRQVASEHVRALESKGFLKRGRGHRKLRATPAAWRRVVALEEQRTGRRAGVAAGASPQVVFALRQLIRTVPKDQRQLVLEFACG